MTEAPPKEDFKPIFLIAMPQLGDPNFFHSVVLMLHHDDSGALGLVINHPPDLDMGTFARSQELACHQSMETGFVFRGGPVEPQRGWILHTNQKVEERQEIFPGMFVSGTADTLGLLLEQGSRPLRLVLGYAGWSPGQLELEMAEGAWLTADVTTDHVLNTDPAQAWDLILKEMGVDPTRLTTATGIH